MKLLEASLATFARYGYRKTSMEEVARAADISRQGLYLHYKTKEDLFHATVEFALAGALAGATARAAAEKGVEARLTGAFDEWTGRYVGLIGADVADLHDATRMVGELLAGYERRFLELIVGVIDASRLPAAHDLPARALADSLYATARGLKHSCATRAEFGERFAVAVRVMCRPLGRRG